MLIDGNYFASHNENVFNERHRLSRKGVISITIIVKNNQLTREPLIDSVGFLYKKEFSTFIPFLTEKLKNLLKAYQKTKFNNLKEKEFKFQKDLEKIIFDQLRRRPTVIANILHV